VTDLVFLRATAVLILGASAYFYRPFQLDPLAAAITGFARWSGIGRRITAPSAHRHATSRWRYRRMRRYRLGFARKPRVEPSLSGSNSRAFRSCS
jgi:hypothetical protein